MTSKRLRGLRLASRKASLVIQGIVLASATLVPILAQNSASASQLTNRVASIDTAKPSATIQMTFQFRLPSSSALQSAQFEICDSPLGTCAGTSSTIASVPAGSTVSQNGNWTNSTAWGSYARASTGTASNNQISVSRTQAAAETQSGTNDRSITFTGLTAPSNANQSYYIRMRLYSDTGFSSLVFDGTVAQSTSQTLTVNARVQEVLQFCIGSTAVNDATTSINGVTGCAAATGTSVDLGTVTSSAVSVTPVTSTNGGDQKNAYAMIQTNAQNGVTIGYKSVLDTSSGKLKVVGAACSGLSTTDQCFNSQGTTQGTFTAGAENFGMTVAGINCGDVPGTAYTCNFGAGQTNLQPQTNYIGGSYTYGSAGTYGSGSGFAWDDTGTLQTIASSASSTQKVVANEALVLKFAATAQITTPTGVYQAQGDFIATPTF